MASSNEKSFFCPPDGYAMDPGSSAAELLRKAKSKVVRWKGNSICAYEGKTFYHSAMISDICFQVTSNSNKRKRQLIFDR